MKVLSILACISTASAATTMCSIAQSDNSNGNVECYHSPDRSSDLVALLPVGAQYQFDCQVAGEAINGDNGWDYSSSLNCFVWRELTDNSNCCSNCLATCASGQPQDVKGSMPSQQAAPFPPAQRPQPQRTTVVVNQPTRTIVKTETIRPLPQTQTVVETETRRLPRPSRTRTVVVSEVRTQTIARPAPTRTVVVNRPEPARTRTVVVRPTATIVEGERHRHHHHEEEDKPAKVERHGERGERHGHHHPDAAAAGA